jgi:glutamine synthetase
MTTTLNGQAGVAAAARGVADRLAANGVKYAAISFVDMHGKPKCKMVPLGHLEQAAMGSEMFTGAALDGVPPGRERRRGRPAPRSRRADRHAIQPRSRLVPR